LADRRHGVQVRVRVRGVVGLYLLEQRCFAGIVEAEQEDGILWSASELDLDASRPHAFFAGGI
jgi:hypothetical protein